jgi:AcrR family transcriptional regulator
MAQRATSARKPLSRERIIRAALKQVDRRGAEAFSMRSLAADLGVEAMSLYNHVPNKAALLDGVAEAVLAEIEIPADAGSDWETRARALAQAFRRVALAHPRAFALVLTRRLSSPGALRRLEATLGVLRDAGFTGEIAVHLLRAFAAYESGSLLREVGALFPPGGHPPDRYLSGTDELARGELPLVSQLAPLLASCDHAAEYDFGLEVLLTALRGMRKGDGGSAQHTARRRRDRRPRREARRDGA